MASPFPSIFYTLYKRSLSPLIHAVTRTVGACRFQPTCSEYAVLAVAQRGWLRGGWLALYRILRCSPLSRGGFDPVPGTWPCAPLDGDGKSDASCRVGPSHLP